jgi:predicted enzyme related to lactoylglutathione lyase
VATTAQPLIRGVDFIALPTRDWEAARRFYGETLALAEGKRWGSMPAGEFETGTVTIAVMQCDAFGMEFSASSTPLEFHVDDVEAAKATLESRGVEFVSDIIDSGVCKQAIFRDPDGNSLALHHRYAP